MRGFVFHGIIQEEEDNYSAVCLELEVDAQGCSQEEARKNLRAAVEGYIEKDNQKEKLHFGNVPEESEDVYFSNLKILLHSNFYGFREVIYV